ncbi:hypothetical protein F090043F1_39650 [Parabacteroides goldsteinii]
MLVRGRVKGINGVSNLLSFNNKEDGKKVQFPPQGTVISQAGNTCFLWKNLEFPAKEIVTGLNEANKYPPKQAHFVRVFVQKEQ